MKVRIERCSYGTYEVLTRPHWFMPWRWKIKFYISATCLDNAINKANKTFDDLEIGRTYAEWKR